MAKIYYGIAGEGRGHATRALSLLHRFGDRHQFTLATSHDALEFLQSATSDLDNVEVRAIPGIKFHYTDGKLDLLLSIRHGLGYLAMLPPRAATTAAKLKKEGFDLVLSDFESTASWSALLSGIPLLSIDHQHFMTSYDLGLLPARLRRWAWRMAWVNRATHCWQAGTVVSAFFKPPLKPGRDNVLQVGPLLRPELRRLQPKVGDYWLGYMRRATPDAVLDVLADSRLPIRIYGLGQRPARGELEFRDLHPVEFPAQLAGCRGVIGAAGNQLIGEALYFGKPFLALPERRHHEQQINSHFLANMGAGMRHDLETLDAAVVQQFVDNQTAFRAEAESYQGNLDGTVDAAAAIEAAVEFAAEHRARSTRAGRLRFDQVDLQPYLNRVLNP